MSLRLSQLDANDVQVDPPPSQEPTDQPRRRRRYYGDARRNQVNLTTSKLSVNGGGKRNVQGENRIIVGKRDDGETSSELLGTRSLPESSRTHLTKASGVSMRPTIGNPSSVPNSSISKNDASTEALRSKHLTITRETNTRPSSKSRPKKRTRQQEEILPYLTAPEEGSYNECGLWVAKPSQPAAKIQQSEEKDDEEEHDPPKQLANTSTTPSAGPKPILSSSPPPTLLVTPALRFDRGPQNRLTLTRTAARQGSKAGQATPQVPLLYSDTKTLVETSPSHPDSGLLLKTTQDSMGRKHLFLSPSQDTDTSTDAEDENETLDREDTESPVRRPKTRRSRLRRPDHSPYVLNSQTDEDQHPRPSRELASQVESPTPPRHSSQAAATFNNPLTSRTWRDPFPHIPAANAQSAAPFPYRQPAGGESPYHVPGEVLVEDSDLEDEIHIRKHALPERGSSISKSGRSRRSKRKEKTYGRGRFHVYKSGIPDPLKGSGHYSYSQQSPSPSCRGAKRRGSTSLWPPSPRNPADGIDPLQSLLVRKRYSRNGPFPGAAMQQLFYSDSPPPPRKPDRHSPHIPLTKAFECAKSLSNAGTEDEYDPDQEKRRRRRRRKDFARRYLLDKGNEARLVLNPNPSCAVRLDNYIEGIQSKHLRKYSRKAQKALRPIPGYSTKFIQCIPYTEHVRRYQEKHRSSNQPTAKASICRRVNELIAAGRQSRFEMAIRKQRPYIKEMTPFMALPGLTPTRDDHQFDDPIVDEPVRSPTRSRRTRNRIPPASKILPRLPFTTKEPREPVSQQTTVKESVQTDIDERRSPTIVLGHIFHDDQSSRSNRARGPMPRPFIAQDQPEEDVQLHVDDREAPQDEDIDPQIGQFATQVIEMANDMHSNEPMVLSQSSRPNEHLEVDLRNEALGPQPHGNIDIDPNELMAAVEAALARQKVEEEHREEDSEVQLQEEHADVARDSFEDATPPRRSRSPALTPRQEEESFDLNALAQFDPSELLVLDQQLSQQEAEREDRRSSRRSATAALDNTEQAAWKSGQELAKDVSPVQTSHVSASTADTSRQSADKRPSSDLSNHNRSIVKPRNQHSRPARPKPAGAGPLQLISQAPAKCTSGATSSKHMSGIEVTPHLMDRFAPQSAAATDSSFNNNSAMFSRDRSAPSDRMRRQEEREKRIQEKRKSERQTKLPFVSVRRSPPGERSTDFRRHDEEKVPLHQRRVVVHEAQGRLLEAVPPKPPCEASPLGSSRSVAHIPLTRSATDRPPRVSVNVSAPSKINLIRNHTGVLKLSDGNLPPTAAQLEAKYGRKSFVALTTPYKNPTQPQSQNFRCQSQARPLSPTQVSNRALPTTRKSPSKSDLLEIRVDQDEVDDYEDEFASPAPSACQDIPSQILPRGVNDQKGDVETEIEYSQKQGGNPFANYPPAPAADSISNPLSKKPSAIGSCRTRDPRGGRRFGTEL
ncbi:hypothetical protein IAR55_000945 [Kwoniella newhampshirensis]|uniref:Uncharacterized protein n=1 Tax=Kwoniella newhampshirensis TaxID=1651941 RepID=A0AAW0Z4A6_9TREE